ncbi:MAG: hypothetical protein A2Y76_01900 [Planctomycetes bacterium RBG_13_60_9]|nr:MAG: hypothetical protein A2Y76_01900 [Planctomycetes bacterium RBG_13_60_9]
MTGSFRGAADFDPGPQEDILMSAGDWDLFLSKFDSSGNYIWARTWGGIGADYGCEVEWDESGILYVMGDFEGEVDFNPGPGMDSHMSNGWHDIFLSKFDSFGNFIWARAWGGRRDDFGCALAVDGSGNSHATGMFFGTVDFDPGPGEDIHTSVGDSDVFVSKFDSSGGLIWARTWGGPYELSGIRALDVSADRSGNSYVTGTFSMSVDFDPGPGEDIRAAIDDYDVFLSKFDSGGDFIWTRTWGGNSFDYGEGVSIDDSGDVCVTGVFADLTDFDPGPGEDYHESVGPGDRFLSRFNSDGYFIWARTWEGGMDIYYIGQGNQSVAIDGSGNPYVTGIFENEVDFDPGPDVENRVSLGHTDAYLSKFDSNGDFIWVQTWGGVLWESSGRVAVDGPGNSYATGSFGASVDFNPGPGSDNHVATGECDAFLVKFPPDGNW